MTNHASPAKEPRLTEAQIDMLHCLSGEHWLWAGISKNRGGGWYVLDASEERSAAVLARHGLAEFRGSMGVECRLTEPGLEIYRKYKEQGKWKT